MWTRIYRSAETLERRHEVALALVDQDEPLLAPLFVEALSWLVADERSHTALTKRQPYNRMLTLVITELGELRAVEAAPVVMQVVEFTEDDSVRAAAVAALGLMGAQEVAPDLAVLLRNLNFESAGRQGAREQRQLKERLARETVVALGRLRQVVGFEPAFFASIGWYSRDSDVAEQAQLAMNLMVSDPSPLFEDMIRSNADFDVKLAALVAQDNSLAPDAGKVTAAVAALEQGLNHHPSNSTEEVTLSRLRNRAAEMILNYGEGDEAAIADLKRAIYIDYDINERLAEITALRVIGTDEAITVLTEYLRYQNQRQLEGIGPRDYRTIYATLRALGESGSQIGREDITMVEFSGWTPAVEQAAAEALQMLDGAGR